MTVQQVTWSHWNAGGFKDYLAPGELLTDGLSQVGFGRDDVDKSPCF